jgi:hypothetical protein
VLPLFKQPSVEVFHVRVDEPVTTVTNIILAAICFYAFFRIAQPGGAEKIRGYFKYYFLTLGLGALFGGLLGHAFLYSLSPAWKLLSWVLILFSVAILAHALAEMARPVIKPAFCRLVRWLNLLILFTALLVTSLTLEFSTVKYYSIFGMVVIVGSMSYILYRRTGNRAMVMLLMAVGIGSVSAVVFATGWGVSPWFNHKDISHLIISISVLFIYKGAARILDLGTDLS